MEKYHDGTGTLALQLVRNGTKARDDIACQVPAYSMYLSSFMIDFSCWVLFELTMCIVQLYLRYRININSKIDYPINHLYFPRVIRTADDFIEPGKNRIEVLRAE